MRSYPSLLEQTKTDVQDALSRSVDEALRQFADELEPSDIRRLRERLAGRQSPIVALAEHAVSDVDQLRRAQQAFGLDHTGASFRPEGSHRPRGRAARSNGGGGKAAGEGKGATDEPPGTAITASHAQQPDEQGQPSLRALASFLAPAAETTKRAGMHVLEEQVRRTGRALDEELLEQCLAEIRAYIGARRQQARGQDEVAKLYGQPLTGVDVRALRARADRTSFFRTRRLTELGELLGRSEGGSFGIAGSRGVGKSTALDNLAALLPPEMQDRTRVLTVPVSAPSAYVPREFLLHLLRQIAHTWIEDSGVLHATTARAEALGGGPPRRLLPPAATLALGTTLPILSLALGAWLLLTYGLRRDLSEPAGSLPLVAALLTVLAGLAVTVGAAGRLRQQLREAEAAARMVSDTAPRSGLWVPRARTAGILLAAVFGVLLMGSMVLLDFTYRRALPWQSSGELAAALLLVVAAAVFVVVRATLDLTLVGTSTAAATTLAVAALTAAMAAGVQGLLRLLADAVVLDGALLLGACALAAGVSVCALRALATVGLDARQVEGPGRALRLAAEAIRRVEFKESATSGWSAAAKFGASAYLPLGVDHTTSRSRTRSEAELTTPEVVSMICTLLGAIRDDMLEARDDPEADVRVFVVIDELDKLEGDVGARDFLNEVKGIFDAPGVTFIVSVSDEALASFERRGLAFRDAVDSAFDEILHLPQLSLAESTEVLRRKVLDVPPPFTALGHCLSGGLPRDLVRAIDRMAAQKDDRTLAAVTVATVHRELRGKWYAVLGALRSIALEPHVTNLIKVLYRIDSCPEHKPGRGRCLARPDAFDEVVALDLPEVKESELSQLRTTLRLAGEYVAFAYYCRTLVQFFDLEVEGRLDALRRAEQADEDVREGLDYLARSRNSLGANARLGWEQVSFFRAAHGLEPVLEFPAVLLNGVAAEPA